MTITKVEYSNSIEYIQPNYLKGWRSFVVHGELSDGENEDEAKSKLVSKVEAWHRDFVQQPVAQMEEQVIQLDNNNPKSEVQAMLDGIEACTQIDGDGEFSLGTFWLRAKGNLATSAAYKLKEKQLKDAK